MPPDRRAARVLLWSLGVLAVVHLGAQLADERWLETGTQVLLMPLLAATVLLETTAPRGRLVSLTLVALGLSWCGDTAPHLADGDAAFLLMVGFFLLAQLAYIAAFWPFRARSVLHRRRWLLGLYLAAVAGLVVACLPGADEMVPAVLVYGLCLGTMAVLATGVNRATAAGGALFLASDGLIALGEFAPGFDLPNQGFWVMSTYLAAQTLIAGGVLAEYRRAGSGQAQSPTASRPRRTSLGSGASTISSSLPS